MNIAFIAKRYDTIGGTERDLYELSRYLNQFGHEIHIYCQEVRIEPPNGIKIHKVPYLGIGRTANSWGLAFLGPTMAYKCGHDLVIGFTKLLMQDIIRCGGGTHKVFLQRMMKAESPIKRMFSVLSPYHNSLLAIERRQYKKGNYAKVLAISGVVKREIMDVYMVPDGDIDVIYDGIDTKLFNPENKRSYRESVRREFGIPSDVPLCLFLGNGFKVKGLASLLNSLAFIKNDDLFCMVVGKDTSISSYMNKAKLLGIGDRVLFVGPQRDVARFYAAADFFVLPSVHEAFGNVILEAMASGLPVITTRVAGASELLSDELERYVLENPHDTKTLSSLMEELLDPKLRNRLSLKAREIAGVYTLDKNARAFEELCRKVLEEKRRCQST